MGHRSFRQLIPWVLVGAVVGSLGGDEAAADTPSARGAPRASSAPITPLLPLLQRRRLGFDVGMTTRQRIVIRDSVAWKQLWQRLAGEHWPSLAIPWVNFASQVVIVVAMDFPNPSSRITVDDVSFAGSSARITVTEHYAGAGCSVLTVESPMVEMVAVPRFTGQATFIERTEESGCK